MAQAGRRWFANTASGKVSESRTAPILRSLITCPVCGHAAEEIMPRDACWFLYDCRGCGAVLRPMPGYCCVFCSYGSIPCPPLQEARRRTEFGGALGGRGSRSRRAS